MIRLLLTGATIIGPPPISHASPKLAVVATCDADSATLAWRRLSGNDSAADITIADIPCEHLRIRIVGPTTDRATWVASFGTPGIKRGNVILRTSPEALRIGWSVVPRSEERYATVRWTRCDDADMNGDGAIDGADIAEILNRWGANDPICDIDRNGVVDGADLARVLNDWSGA